MLLPNRFQPDPIPSLGRKVEKKEEVKVCPFRAFENAHELAADLIAAGYDMEDPAPPSQQARGDALRKVKWIGESEPILSHFLVGKSEDGVDQWTACLPNWQLSPGAAWIKFRRPFGDEFPKSVYAEVFE